MNMKRLLIATMLAFTLLPLCAQTPAVCEHHPWRGAKVAYFGDSVTDPRNSGSQRKFWQLLAEWLEQTPWVYAVSGRQWNDIPNQMRQLQNDHGDDVDAIIIFCGTNDYNHGVSLGQWYEECDTTVEVAGRQPLHTAQRRMRQPSMDGTTFRGRINIAMSQLKEHYPTKQIVLLTPIHRAFFSSSNRNVQPSEAYQNACGEYVDAYVEAVKEAANVWAVPVIDLNALSGLYPLSAAHGRYFHNATTDLLHPNDDGHRRMALTLLYQLQTLPCRF